MARIAYVDHSFHAKTLSNLFLVELLKRYGHSVDVFWDEQWNGKKGVEFSKVISYDVIIMFQACCTPLDQIYRQKHPNVIFIPMLDQFQLYKGAIFDRSYMWRPFHGSKVLSFSLATHAIAVSHGIYSMPVRYFSPLANKTFRQRLHAFFWIRNESQVSWPMVRALIGDADFDSLHLHICADPNTPSPTLPTDYEIKKYKITTSTWIEDKNDFLNILEKANVFFASRAEEGIGQSFLEAMSRGQCVVALNNGTMNEYIIDGVNGLLYSFNHIKPLNFSQIHKLGENARQTAQQGHENWIRNEKYLVNYILTPAPVLYKKDRQYIIPHRTLNIYKRLATATMLEKHARHIWNWLKRT